MSTNNSVNVGLSGSTGTGNFVGATTPTLITPVLGAATATSITFNPTTGGIVGTTTNDNTGAGKVGEYASTIVLVGSPVNLSNSATVNIATLSLTAGDWDVWGELWIGGPSGTSYTQIVGFISTASATLVTVPGDATSYTQCPQSAALITGTNPLPVFSITPCRISLSGTNNVFLECFALFTVHTGTAWGKIAARRVR